MTSQLSFTDTSPTELYTLSLHDALPIFSAKAKEEAWPKRPISSTSRSSVRPTPYARVPIPSTSSSWPPTSTRRCARRSEEHTSELQSRRDLVCRLLLEKKKKSR